MHTSGYRYSEVVHSRQRVWVYLTGRRRGKDLFVHRSNVKTQNHNLQDGQKVQFVVAQGRKGPEATEVSPV